MTTKTHTFNGYARPDGSVGIRNKVLIIAVDECADGVARNIAKGFDDTVVLTNWYTCMLGGNEETFHQMIEVGRNPNVAAVLVIAMGCGSILPEQIAAPIGREGKPTATMSIDKAGGSRNAIREGRDKLAALVTFRNGLARESFPVSRLVVGVKCGGSDTSSGMTSNPTAGAAVDKLIAMGATAIGGELFELQGTEPVLDKRAATPEVARKIRRLIDNENRRWGVAGVEVETMSIGNCVGGLTTIEEKSLGALHKTGEQPIQDVLTIGPDGVDKPTAPGFYLSETTMLCGGAGVNFAALGAHLILWTTASAGFNNAIIPVIRISGCKELINPDIDIDATGLVDGTATLDAVSDQAVAKAIRVASGEPTAVEDIADATMTLYQKDRRLESLLNLTCPK